MSGSSSTRTTDLSAAAGAVRLHHAGDELFEHVRGFRWGDGAAERLAAEVWLRPGGERIMLPAKAVRVGYTSTYHVYELDGRTVVILNDQLLMRLDYEARTLAVDYSEADEGVRWLVRRAFTSLLIASLRERGGWFVEASAWRAAGRIVLLAGQGGCGREELLDRLEQRAPGAILAAPVHIDTDGVVHAFPIPTEDAALAAEGAPPTWTESVEAIIWVARWNDERSELKPVRRHVMAERLSEPIRRYRLLPHSRRWRGYNIRPQLQGLDCFDLCLGTDRTAAEAELLGSRRAD